MNLSSLENLGIRRVLDRGTGEILEQSAGSILVRDSVSGAYLLACDDAAHGEALLDRCAALDCALMMLSNEALVPAALARCGFAESFLCYQVAYYGAPPETNDSLAVRFAEKRDLPFLLAHYDRIEPEELERLVEMRTILLGFAQQQPVGFIGEHLEGSMGLLYILPEHRRRGYAAALEKRYIALTMERGFVPFGQVEIGNTASLRLQKTLGMTRSAQRICWMWK